MLSARLFLLCVMLLLGSPTVSGAQRASLGPSISVMGGGRGVSGGGCGYDPHDVAIGVHGFRPWGRVVTLQVAMRAYWITLGPRCYSAPEPPPADGTYVVEDRDPLQARPYVTTDARVGISLPNNAAMLSAGGGTAWREGHNAPYFVAALGLPFLDGTINRFGFQVEYQWVHLTNDRARRTFQNGQITAEQPLGPVHHWSHAITVGLRWGFRL